MPFRRSGMAAQPFGDGIVIACGHGDHLEVHLDTLIASSDVLQPGPLRVNSGGSAYETWCGDHGSLEGKVLENLAIPDIGGTLDDAIYRTARIGDPSESGTVHYRIPNDPGPCRLLLHFAEIEFGATGGVPGGPGSRVFDVARENVTVIESLDVAALVGVETALVLEIDFDSQSSAVDMILTGVVGAPLLSALELVRLPAGSIVSTCTSTPNSTGAPAVIASSGTISIASNDLELIAGPVPDLFGLFFYGPGRAQDPFGNGTLCVAAPIVRFDAQPIANATLRYRIDNELPPQTSQLMPGSTWVFQAWYRDPAAGGAGFDLSNGLELTFLP
ncbi:MAG: hypothetical protein GY711_35230 [bacterium]|nr:hypothetical protein [bacterium]